MTDTERELAQDPDFERNNRNLSDLLQELRVAGLGVQMLFGFLLSLPFTVRFAQLSASQRDLYKADIISAAAASALLISPVAYHRWVFRRHEKSRLLKRANVEAILGLAMVLVAVCLSVCLSLSFVGISWGFAVFVAVVIAGFLFLWFILPMYDRLQSDKRNGIGKTKMDRR